jgi:tetratricopeptide (TPR) repeat protein
VFFYQQTPADRTGAAESATPAATSKASYISGSGAGYVDSESCIPCHQRIWETYQHTGMARSFFRPRAENVIGNFEGEKPFRHQASERYYTMHQRGGKYYQRRHQVDFDGKEANVVEKEIHYVMGSGNHVRSYLHLAPDGTLYQLPVAWYAGKDGGYWAMNPGYDRALHDGFRRVVDTVCMFCHNAYPEIEAGSDAEGHNRLFSGKIPEGIDCQRCHGPGLAHIQAAGDGKDVSAVQAAIVNPVRLSPERQMEVCMQCHLESTSRPLPHAIQRYARGPLSYQAGEPLGDFMLHFDHPKGARLEDKFEIAHAAYRLRKSACFQKSAGQMTCTTCHNPHDVLRGEEAARHYSETCRGCHGRSFDRLVESGRHTEAADCLAFHMPKRRTDDVVRVVMTDHYIQRHKPAGDLVAPRQESYEPYGGEVALYYPPSLPPGADRDLYLGMAQLVQKTNLEAGVPMLERAIATHQPKEAGFYFDLPEAYVERGNAAQEGAARTNEDATRTNNDKAIAMYEEAITRRPEFTRALMRLGVLLRQDGRLAASQKTLLRAAEIAPADASVLKELGLTYLQQNELARAADAFRKALRIDPDMAELQSNLAGILWDQGRGGEAEAAAREAVRLEPDLAEAHNNLANILSGQLSGQQDFREARFHFEKSIKLNPRHARSRHNYAVALIERGREHEARPRLQAAVRLDSSVADSHLLLGSLAEMDSDLERAVIQYDLAIKAQPDFAAAHLSLGVVKLSQGRLGEAKKALGEALRLRPELAEADLSLGNILTGEGNQAEARAHFQKASGSQDQAVREAALQALAALGPGSSPAQ